MNKDKVWFIDHQCGYFPVVEGELIYESFCMCKIKGNYNTEYSVPSKYVFKSESEARKRQEELLRVFRGL